MFLNLTPTSKIAQKKQKKKRKKIAPNGQKECRRGPKCGKIKKKTHDMAVLPKPKLIVYIGRF